MREFSIYDGRFDQSDGIPAFEPMNFGPPGWTEWV